jgi:hypothetical protein
MSCSALQTISLASIFFLASSTAFAQCTEDHRAQEVGDQVVQLRTYLCRTGRSPNDPQIRVEIDRLSDLAASAIALRRSSEALTRVIGAPKLIENEVLRVYSDLLKRFGTALEGSINWRLDAAGAGGTASSNSSDKAASILGGGGFYPAIEELAALERKRIPEGLTYFYTKEGGMVFWRSMKLDDVTNYSRRMTAYNKRFAPKDYHSPVGIPRELRLASFLAGNDWPDEFMIMSGTVEDGCLGGFSYALPEFVVDVVIIENTSNIPIILNDILGVQPSDTRLRLAMPSRLRPGAVNPLGLPMGTLGPREKVLIPLKISLVPSRETTAEFRDPESANQIHKQVGARGYGGNVGGFGAPSFRNYVYGPEITMSGVVVNGTRIDLEGRSANYLEMTMSREEGSCPYLLSQAADGDWINYGKVLHKALNKESEYTELRTFHDFKHRFRLEEQEPEMAFIDQVELIAVLKTGHTLTLIADNPKLRRRDGEYLRLLWGHAIDINFSLPTGLHEEDVVESRLYVTGYYLRYSDLLANSVTTQSMTRPSGLARDP